MSQAHDGGTLPAAGDQQDKAAQYTQYAGDNVIRIGGGSAFRGAPRREFPRATRRARCTRPFPRKSVADRAGGSQASSTRGEEGGLSDSRVLFTFLVSTRIISLPQLDLFHLRDCMPWTGVPSGDHFNLNDGHQFGSRVSCRYMYSCKIRPAGGQQRRAAGAWH